MLTLYFNLVAFSDLAEVYETGFRGCKCSESLRHGRSGYRFDPRNADCLLDVNARGYSESLLVIDRIKICFNSISVFSQITDSGNLV